MTFKPEFYSKWEILKFAFKSNPSFRHLDISGMQSILKLRKKLLLDRIVKFNNQYYSTLTIPAFPSPAYNKAAAVGFDDHNPKRFEIIRQKGLYDDAVNALRLFNEAGILTYVNLCASKAIIHSGSLYEYYNFVKELNVSFIQLLEPRESGGYLFNEEAVIPDEEERNILVEFTRETNFNRRYKDGPIVYYVAHIEGKGQMGCCMGGLSHFHLDSAGNVNPCVFLPVSFGNIMDEEFTNIFIRMREAVPHPLHKECASLTLSDTIRKHSSEGVPVPFNKIKTEWEELL